MTKAYLVNIDIVLLADSEEEAKKEVMRVAPQIHMDEVPSIDSRICYVEERLICPACKGVNIESAVHIVRGKIHRCKDCHEVWR